MLVLASAKRDPGALGIAVAWLIVKYPLNEGAPLTVAADGTSFRRRGRHAAEARRAYDGSAQDGKKTASGNTRVTAAIVVKLPCCPSPAAPSALSRLRRGKDTASQAKLAAELTELLVKAFPGRETHGAGDAAFHGEALVIKGTTWTTRLPASAVISGLKPPPAGRRGRPRETGERIGKCKDAAAAADWREVTVRIYGREQKVQAAAFPGLWHGSFKGAPGQLVLMREPDPGKPYDLGIFTLDTRLSPAEAIERYSWRRPIEPSNTAGKQVTGADDARNRTAKAAERSVPFAFLAQSLMIAWHAAACDPAAGMHAALRDALTSAPINAISQDGGESRKTVTSTLTSEARAA